jgi:hypothetical protein
MLKEILIRETQKILNFASSHWPEAQINNLLLATPALEEKISQIITENFPLVAQKIILPSEMTAPDGSWSIINDKLSSLTSDWFSVLGSALRGLIPRSRDIIISLADTGTEEEFRQYQLINFIKIWRNVVLTTISFVLVAFMGIYGFLIKTTNSLNNQLANLANLPELEEINKLQTEAEEFNERVELGIQVKNQIYKWSPFFEKIKTLAGSEVSIERIFIQSQDTPVLFNGRAVNEKAIIDFKTKLEQDSQIENINLSLSGITPTAEGSFIFTITFKLKS